MLVSLADMKTYLGISGATYDAFLTEQLNLISDAIEKYCGRIFTSTTFTQTFYQSDYEDMYTYLTLKSYPVTELTSIVEGTVDISADVRLHKSTGTLINPNGWFINDEKVEVEFKAGFTAIPTTIQSVVKSLVEERYNKKVNGLELGFGSDVQSISIPGVLNVQYDFSLQNNERKNGMAMLLGNYLNVLDMYRSEKVLTGPIGFEYE